MRFLGHKFLMAPRFEPINFQPRFLLAMQLFLPKKVWPYFGWIGLVFPVGSFYECPDLE